MTKLPGHTTKLALVVLFIAAVWVRADGLGDYPYFKGRSATNYRHASLIADTGTLPGSETQAGWPEGYDPARVQPNGVEYITGFTYRLVRLFSDMPQKNFFRLYTIMFFALSVFAVRRLTWELWRCEAAALIAPLLVALFGPLVLATNGSDFDHVTFATPLIVLHLALYFGLMRHNASWPRAALAAVTAALLLATWEGAALYLAVFCMFATFGGGFEPRTRRLLLLLHLIAMLAAGAVLPYLRETRLLADWPWWLFVAATVYVTIKDRLPARAPGPVYFLVGFGALGILSKPFRGNALTSLDYWQARFLHLGGKPFEPGGMSDAGRYLWTLDHARPIPQAVLEFALPMIFLLPIALLAMRQLKREGTFFSWQPIGLAIIGLVLFLFDRSAVIAASLGVIPLASLAGYALSQHVKTRVAPLAIGVLLVLLSTTSGSVAGKVGARMRLTPIGGDGFLQVSIGNADKQLVRHLVSRTSVRDPMLAPSSVASLMVTFAGRTTVSNAMLPHAGEMARFMDVTKRYYGSEDELYAYCQSLAIRYVLYTVDLLMDASHDSPRYTAGLRGIPVDAVVERMHFAPAGLHHFNLVYENDNYRLFRVTAEQEPLFLTDHPVVYQRDIMRRHGDTLAHFHDRVVDILVTYHTAVEALRRADEEEAIRRFRYCVEQAPKFTAAWLGAGDSFTRLAEYEAANAAYQRVLAYAPDNEHALYYGALTHAHLGNTDDAIGLIDLLLTVSRDRDLVDLATELKAVIEAGLSLETVPPR